MWLVNGNSDHLFDCLDGLYTRSWAPIEHSESILLIT